MINIFIIHTWVTFACHVIMYKLIIFSIIQNFVFSCASGREIRMANCIHLDKPDTINNHASPLQDVTWWQERSLMVRWVVGSILHRVDPLSYFSFQPVLNDWCNTGHGMCYPVCGMVHIKEPLLLIRKGSPCGGSGLPLSLSEWPFTI